MEQDDTIAYLVISSSPVLGTFETIHQQRTLLQVVFTRSQGVVLAAAFVSAVQR